MIHGGDIAGLQRDRATIMFYRRGAIGPKVKQIPEAEMNLGMTRIEPEGAFERRLSGSEIPK
jgi:hypothetical protein